MKILLNIIELIISILTNKPIMIIRINSLILYQTLKLLHVQCMLFGEIMQLLQ